MDFIEGRASLPDLVGRGIDVWHGALFPPEAPLSGHNPKRASYLSFCSFKDPDGDTWLIQEITTRPPGNVMRHLPLRRAW